MSYILDALRRADAERRRGQSPVLTDGTVLSPAGGASPRPGTGRRLVAGVALALLAAGAALAWWLSRPGPAPGAVAPSAPVMPAPSPAASPAPSPPAPSLPAPLPPVPVAPTPQPAPPITPAPAAVPAQPPAAVRLPPSAPLPAAEPARAIPLASLPEPQRSAVTRLSFGGAVHSADRAQSFVLLAGQIVREGETLAPGIVLERIGPRQLLLRVGEQPVEVPL